MLTLVGGGVRSGKSAFAIRRARELGERRLFIATARALDDEMAERIAAHRAERGKAFETFEAAGNLQGALVKLRSYDVAVIDCLTLLVSDRIVAGDEDAAIDRSAGAILEAARGSPCHVIVVTNEVGLGIVPTSALARRFRDAAGRAHQRLARGADEVYLGVLGLMVRLVPAPLSVVDAGRLGGDR